MTFDLEKARATYSAGCAEDAANLVPDLIAEIERLRGFETAARDLNNDLIRIAGERDELAARIQELEDALVERSAIVMFLQEAWGSTIQFRAAKAQMGEWKRLPEDFKESWRKGARKQLQAEGKIGPDADAKPHCWQITEERRAAIDRGMRFLAWSNAKTNNPGTEIDLAVLRAMLTEAGQE